MYYVSLNLVTLINYLNTSEMIKILFPTDFSATADNAFIYAMQICKNYNGILSVLHSYSSKSSSKNNAANTSDVGTVNSMDASDLFKDQINKMYQLAVENDLGQVSLKFFIEEGELVQSILDLVSKDSINLIVMGTTGNSGFENKILGSTTVGVINNIDIPVLSIPHLCKFQEIDAVGFTTVYDDEDALVLRKMIPYVKSASADIYCIHVNKGKQSKTQEEISSWKQQFKQDPVYFIEKNQDDIVKAVFNSIDQYSIDMLSCITRNKSLFQRVFEGSIAEKLSYHKRIPLITFHENMFK